MAITKVEYFNGATKIGERTAEPFGEFTWTNAPLGAQSLTAKLYVDGVLADTSSEIGVTVNEAVAASALLDTYTGAAAGYSLRKLRGAYSGAAIEVRRSSDNTVQNIGFNASGDLDTTALTNFVGVNDGFVSKWYDQVGIANALQAAAVSQAKIVNAGAVILKNSRPALDFSQDWYDLGVGRVGNTGLFTGPAEQFTTINVFSAPINVDGNILARSGATNGSRTFQLWIGRNITTGSTPAIQLRGTLNDTGAALDDGNPHVFFTNWDGTQALKGWDSANNSSLLTGTAAENTENINIGARAQGGGAFTGTQQEVIIWDVSKIADIDAIKTNVRTYYGI